MLLVLSNGGYLAPPDENPEREQLWTETWKRINRFQPNLFAELFPDEVGKPTRQRAEKDESVSREERREIDVAVRGSREGGGEQEEGESGEGEVEVQAEENGVASEGS